MTNPSDAASIWIPGDDCYAFIKGRVGLYAILRAAGIGDGDEVLIPGFTCFVVAAAVTYSGARAVYYDIDPATYNGDPRRAAERLSPSTRAVIVQHTFGMPMEMGDLVARCRKREILVIEDCAHAMGAETAAGRVGALGDAAFASLQWSKPVTTGLGGLARVNTEDLSKQMARVYHREFTEPSWLKSITLATLASLHNRFFRPRDYWRIRGAYHRLSRLGMLQGSSSDSEFTDPRMPEGYRQRFGGPRLGQLRRVLAGLQQTIEHRRRIASIYLAWCGERNLLTQRVTPGSDPTYLRFPLLVEGREELLTAAREQRLELGDWLNAPLHPREADACAFGYAPNTCPVAEGVAERIVNLPTHHHVDEREASRILHFLEAHEARIIRAPRGVTAPSSM